MALPLVAIITLIISYRNRLVIVDLLCGRYHVPLNVFLVIVDSA